MFLLQVAEQVGGGGGEHGEHSGTLHSGLHNPFLMLLKQVEEQVGGSRWGGGGGTQGGHSGTSH